MISKLLLSCAIVISICTNAVEGQDQKPDLKPGQGFRLSFPDLPPTLIANQINPTIQTGVSVQLPNWHCQGVPDHEHEFAEEYHAMIRNWAKEIKPPKQ